MGLSMEQVEHPDSTNRLIVWMRCGHTSPPSSRRHKVLFWITDEWMTHNTTLKYLSGIGRNMAIVKCKNAEEWREHYIKALNADGLLRYSCGYSQVIDGVGDHLECAEDLEELNTLREQATGFLNALGYMFGLGSQKPKMQALEDAYDEMCREHGWDA